MPKHVNSALTQLESLSALPTAAAIGPCNLPKYPQSSTSQDSCDFRKEGAVFNPESLKVVLGDTTVRFHAVYPASERPSDLETLAMATFAKSTFSASSYAAFRPKYPPRIYNIILDYHRGPRKLCVDLGCGHGVVSRNFAPFFESIIGTDPSAVMVKQAVSTTKEANVKFRQAFAEDLDFVEDRSLDLVVAGQAAHWFDFGKVWPELQRKLRTGGTLAFFGYKDNVFVDYPNATSTMDHYVYGPDKNLMGMYWEQPGRNILRDRLRAVVPPEQDFEDVRRLEYEPGVNGCNSGTLGERLMYKHLKLGEMESYVRTFSAYHGWLQAHPDRKPRAEGGPGDIVDEMFDKLLEVEPDWQKEGDNWREKVVETEWGSAMLLARKK